MGTLRASGVAISQANSIKLIAAPAPSDFSNQSGATEDAKAAAGLKRLNFVAERLNEDCLGADFCVADAYLLMILMWLARTTFSLRDLCPA